MKYKIICKTLTNGDTVYTAKFKKFLFWYTLEEEDDCGNGFPVKRFTKEDIQKAIQWDINQRNGDTIVEIYKELFRGG